MQVQIPVRKKRIPWSSIFVVIGCALLIIRIILYYLPAKPTEAPIDIQNTPIVSVQTQSPAPSFIPTSEKEKAVATSVVSETFRLAAGSTVLSLQVTGGPLLTILTSAKERGEIAFSGKEYPGLGFFVTEFGSLKEGDGKHLMYFINGKEASVGVSLYIPKAGDSVVWELK
jgi:hypothetical protein